MEENAVWEKQWTPRYLPSLGDEPWDAVWDRLTQGFRRETVPAGTVLYQQGDPADEVLYLQSGQVRLECVHSGGKRRVLCLLFDGIPVGEDECIYGGVREFRAVAATRCQVFRIPAEVFKRRAETSPALALKLFQVSARKSQVLSRLLVRDLRAPRPETVRAQDAAGRVSFRAVYARICAPHYHACAMDGAAIAASLSFGATETTPVTLAAKSHLRNERPVLLAVSTNDGLAAAARNIGELLARRHYFFVPFSQDDPEGKPRSLVAHMEEIPACAACALAGVQRQPLLPGTP